MKNQKKRKVILEGIVGSVAYGLDTENSDVDIKGIYVAPTEDILSLYPVHGTLNKENCEFESDIEYTEVGKFINMALNCNPTYLELLFLDKYSVLDYQGQLLLKYRDYFLSQKALNSYVGYATAQIKKLEAKEKSGELHNYARKEKHIRHCFRLLMQGHELLTTGKITLNVGNQRDFLFELGKKPLGEIKKFFNEKKDLIEADVSNFILPQEPNYKKINELLLKIRKVNYIL